MLRGVEVLGGVFILGRVATADVSASHTKAKMNPGIAQFQTLLTTLGSRSDFVDLVQVGAGCHKV
jgi:hypothetical protein